MRGTKNTVWNVTLLSSDLPESYRRPVPMIRLYDSENLIMTIPSHESDIERDPNTIFTRVFVLVRNEYFENWDRMSKLVPVRLDKRVHYNFLTKKEEIDSMF
jgi:hypothetical protein